MFDLQIIADFSAQILINQNEENCIFFSSVKRKYSIQKKSKATTEGHKTTKKNIKQEMNHKQHHLKTFQPIQKGPYPLITLPALKTAVLS